MPRHSPFRRLVSFVLAVLVLTASVGLTVQRQTCRMSGRSQVAVAVPSQGARPGCAGQRLPARPTVQDDCCDFSSHLHQLSAPAHEQELAAHVLGPAPLLAGWLPAAVWPAGPRLVVLAASGQRWFAADSSPPPWGGRGLLVFACTLVV